MAAGARRHEASRRPQTGSVSRRVPGAFVRDRERSGTLKKRVRLLGALVAIAVGAVPFLSAAPAHAAGPCGPPVVNPVACENTNPGTPSSTWDISGSGDSSIQGFATDISVNVGQTITFKIKSAAAYSIT